MEIIWRDRKRPFLGLPWSFTIYTLTEEKLLVKTGILRQKEEEVRLYRIMDATLARGANLRRGHDPLLLGGQIDPGI